MVYIKKFETHSDYETYIEGEALLPNVSKCADDSADVVHFNPWHMPYNEILYEASAKLSETTSSSSSGLHTNAFNTTIKSHTFENGQGKIVFDGDVTSIGSRAFYSCSGLTSVTIGNSVTRINDEAFLRCTSLTSVTIPSSVKLIGGMAFYNCISLASVTIQDGVQTIGHDAFVLCTNLTSVIIPNSVTTIAFAAFSNCSSLTTMTIEATTPPTLRSTDAISTATTTIYVPSESVNAYKTASNWSAFASKIQAIK